MTTATPSALQQRRAELRKALKDTRPIDEAAPVVCALVAEVLPDARVAFDRDLTDARALGTPEAQLARLVLSLRNLATCCADRSEAEELLYSARSELEHSPG